MTPVAQTPTADRQRPASTFGCLILHGFTSSLDSVRPLVPMAEQLGLPYRMPTLRGHGTQYTDLKGVQAKDWYADGLAALRDLRREVDQVFVCGLSMGGLVALQLAAENQADIAGVVGIAAALRFTAPTAWLSPFLWRTIPTSPIDIRLAFTDQRLAANNKNYTRFTTDSFASLYRYTSVVEQLLPRVVAPLLLIHGRKDRVIRPRASEIIYNKAGSQRKELRWFEESGHEMLMDCEGPGVVAATETFIRTISVPPQEAK